MRFEHKEKEEHFTTQNTFLGTAEFISPEVLLNNETGPECDLWAVGELNFNLGCIIYQMFTGQSPFKEKTEYLVFRKILDSNINLPDVINKN